jgi:hypothetical protein
MGLGQACDRKVRLSRSSRPDDNQLGRMAGGDGNRFAQGLPFLRGLNAVAPRGEADEHEGPVGGGTEHWFFGGITDHHLDVRDVGGDAGFILCCEFKNQRPLRRGFLDGGQFAAANSSTEILDIAGLVDGRQVVLLGEGGSCECHTEDQRGEYSGEMFDHLCVADCRDQEVSSVRQFQPHPILV